MTPRFFTSLMLMAILVGAASPVQAQWLTQRFTIKPGWTAIYLHVDPSEQTLDQLVGSDPGNPIAEVWLWQAPASTLQFVTSPQAPLANSSQWVNWSRGIPNGTGPLVRMNANAAYLVHSTASTDYVWNLKGRPVAPNYSWTSSGLNFLGFPTPPDAPPLFKPFLDPGPAFNSGVTEMYYYPGGDLGATNPARLRSFTTTPVLRGQAFWMRTGSIFNNYFGPFQVSFANTSGVDFGDSASQSSFHLRNLTTNSLTVTLRLVASESPPGFQPDIDRTKAVPPILVRGALNMTNLTYASSNLAVNGTQTWTLAPQGQPGSDVIVVLGLNRQAMTLPPEKLFPDALYAGVLRFTDSLGLTQIDAPVTARAGSYAGLWVGKASVLEVANRLVTYQRDTDNNLVTDPGTGSYLPAGTNTQLGPVVQPFPLQFILHNDGTQVTLLQRVFYGLGTRSNVVVATSERALDPAHRDTARRMSTATLPWSPTNTTWTLSGQLAPGGSLTGTIPLAYDDQASNPFLHTYHPDHDNLDQDPNQPHQLPRGAESYDISRQITLTIAPPNNDFASLAQAGQTFSGTYLETITVAGLNGATRTFNVTGVFALTRLSPIATLTRP